MSLFLPRLFLERPAEAGAGSIAGTGSISSVCSARPRAPVPSIRFRHPVRIRIRSKRRRRPVRAVKNGVFHSGKRRGRYSVSRTRRRDLKREICSPCCVRDARGSDEIVRGLLHRKRGRLEPGVNLEKNFSTHYSVCARTNIFRKV